MMYINHELIKDVYENKLTFKKFTKSSKKFYINIHLDIYISKY